VLGILGQDLPAVCVPAEGKEDAQESAKHRGRSSAAGSFWAELHMNSVLQCMLPWRELT